MVLFSFCFSVILYNLVKNKQIQRLNPESSPSPINQTLKNIYFKLFKKSHDYHSTVFKR